MNLLRLQWDRWLTACLTESEWAESGYVPTFDEYMAIAKVTISLETIVCTAFFFAGAKLTEEALHSHDYHTPLRLVCRVGRILNDITGIEVYTHAQPQIRVYGGFQVLLLQSVT